MRTLKFFFKGINAVTEEKAKQGILWIPCWNLRDEEDSLTAGDILTAIVFSIIVSVPMMLLALCMTGGSSGVCVITVLVSTCLWLLFLSIDRICRQKKIREKKW
jgi:hypothetical protein